MLIRVNDIECIIDKSIGFIMIKSCYLDGLNCYNCRESCPLEDIDAETMANIFK